jgi:hypothetical protein
MVVSSNYRFGELNFWRGAKVVSSITCYILIKDKVYMIHIYKVVLNKILHVEITYILRLWQKCLYTVLGSFFDWIFVSKKRIPLLIMQKRKESEVTFKPQKLKLNVSVVSWLILLLVARGSRTRHPSLIYILRWNSIVNKKTETS